MARTKARQRISYVLPLPNSPPGHRLGVNSLAVDGDSGILYSAGRDGAICSWNLNVNLHPHHYNNDTESLSHPSSPSSSSSAAFAPSTFRDQIQSHTHWVNDITLCQSNTALVSCSSDLTVKLWRPHSTQQQAAETLGVHSDYVKCLAASDSADWVVSGGLDRKIKFWDISGKGETLEIDVGDGGSNPKGSIYSLGTGGGILASGGPESVVRVWDPRSGKRITKFVGHTDNVRAILVSQDGTNFLTASSDTTIKMWSLTAGRCIHTLSMHNDSVWSLYSEHPELAVFHSSDRSGLVAKTDVRNVNDIDEGICFAVCHEKEGVSNVVARGDYVWTATSGSCINRWMDVDTDLAIGQRQRAGTVGSRPRGISMATTASGTTPPVVNGRRRVIPAHALLRLSSSSSFSNIVRDPDAVTVYSSHVRQSSIHESFVDGSEMTKPVNEVPDYTIEGQHGLIKHFMMNDRRRVLTVDTAGEVVMWDLLRCEPVKRFGRRNLEDVAVEVNTKDSIANWCQVDTRTGRLACVLDENYCFDAEIYADEAELEEKLEFKDDQRINLGKWVLRYLFGNLIDAEIARDEAFRKQLETKLQNQPQETSNGRRNNPPAQITLPPPSITIPDASSVATPLAKPNGGYSLFPTTPGMSIGLATPAPFSPGATDDSVRLSMDRSDRDYFSPGLRPSPNTAIADPGGLLPPPTASSATTLEPPSTPAPEEADSEGKGSSSRFGKWRFGGKKMARTTSTDTGAPAKTGEDINGASRPTTTTDPVAADDSIVVVTAEAEDTLLGVIQRIRKDYETQAHTRTASLSSSSSSSSPNGGSQPIGRVESAIAPSLPAETPVLKPPRNTTIIIQEDKPEAGGMSDLYRGTVGSVGEPGDVDILERVAPAWLGDVLLLNRVPLKETVKISFILVPWASGEQGALPILPSESGSEGKHPRLNANRMLRAKKILAYVHEHLQPPFMNENHVPKPEVEGGERPKPEDWLELWCHEQLVPNMMTLSTIRGYMWKTTGDVTLYYKRKEPKPAVEAKPEEVKSEES